MHRNRILPVLALALSLLLGASISPADDYDDPNLREAKAYWQNRYRTLLERAATLRAEIERETELYADANRRNYRRGKKRHVHRKAAEAARIELTEVEKSLSTIEEDGRVAGALPGWFNEIEIEMEDAAPGPAVAGGPDDDGLNTLYPINEDGDDS